MFAGQDLRRAPPLLRPPLSPPSPPAYACSEEEGGGHTPGEGHLLSGPIRRRASESVVISATGFLSAPMGMGRWCALWLVLTLLDALKGQTPNTKPVAGSVLQSFKEDQFQGEWFVIGLAGSTHRRSDKFLLNSFTATFERNENSRLQVSYAMTRGHRCITWSYVLIPAAQPGRFSVDGGRMWIIQTLGAGQICLPGQSSGPVGQQHRLPRPGRRSRQGGSKPSPGPAGTWPHHRSKSIGETSCSALDCTLDPPARACPRSGHWNPQPGIHFCGLGTVSTSPGPVGLPRLDSVLLNSIPSLAAPPAMSVDLGPPGSSRSYRICPPVPASLSQLHVFRSIPCQDFLPFRAE
ncbi:epididymal-specific lipocalin-12 isoform X3 [Canis lupus dingo]|uniref:epididymal-specific lipocalin-12 isoform X3 n=1 Tax=Canis lupus dingo TaxID=286419 RepID=UPI0020C2C534|nr:epididymal-specific lipocalin-12 isoform X3 [Canis lupus dingo]